jgi:hypothetical protein
LPTKSILSKTGSSTSLNIDSEAAERRAKLLGRRVSFDDKAYYKYSDDDIVYSSEKRASRDRGYNADYYTKKDDYKSSPSSRATSGDAYEYSSGYYSTSAPRKPKYYTLNGSLGSEYWLL